MKTNANYRYEQTEDLRAALGSIRQAALRLPEEMEQLQDDLKWVEESLEAAISEQEREEAEGFESSRLGA